MKIEKENKVMLESAASDFAREKKAYAKHYRKLMGLSDTEKITEDMLDPWAMDIVSCRDKCPIDTLKDILLTEDVTVVQAAQADTAAEAQSEKNQIEKALDKALYNSLRAVRDATGRYQNVLLVGDAGIGKTAIVRKWAKQNNINLYEQRAAGMESTDLGGAISPNEKRNAVVRLAATEFDALNRPRSVLFLDEINRASKPVRTNLLELINSHVLPDAREESGQRFLPNFLFTIAAINPSNDMYDTDSMDMAELSRFKEVPIRFDNKQFHDYILKFYDEAIKRSVDEREAKENAGRRAIADKLTSDPNFTFDSQEDMQKGLDQVGQHYHPLNYRSLSNLLDDSDGTKDDFLSEWSSYCNPLKKNMAVDILSSYKDVDDKANAAISQGSDSNVFKKVASNRSKLASAFPELNL